MNKKIIFNEPVPFKDDNGQQSTETSILIYKMPDGSRVYNALGVFAEGMNFFRRLERDKAKELLREGGGGRKFK